MCLGGEAPRSSRDFAISESLKWLRTLKFPKQTCLRRGTEIDHYVKDAVLFIQGEFSSENNNRNIICLLLFELAHQGGALVMIVN